MADIRYLVPRIIRHFLPDEVVRFLLRMGWIIRPGLETRSPEEAVARYLDALKDRDFSLAGKRVLIFGYGGNFATGCRLLEAGASHVILAERSGFQDESNRALLPRYSAYLEERDGHILPRAKCFTLIHGDIRMMASRWQGEPVDIVISSSVYEHLDDVPGITRALARLTRGCGYQLHFIDLRDHFFRYPFEMLCYSPKVWATWLNPSSNHNRYRVWDYRRMFERFFDTVEIDVLERDLPAFEKARARIRPEFLSGDPQMDAITLIRVFTGGPCSCGEDR